jgi:2-oxoglutarate ferredoxin oxidoreductase subunit delta
MFKVIVDENYCKGCRLCVVNCPKDIMAMSDTINAKGQHTAYCKEPETCIGCKSCGIVCPDAAITIEKED